MNISINDLEKTCFYPEKDLKKYRIVCKTNNRAQILGRLCPGWEKDRKCKDNVKSCKNCIYRLIEIGTVISSPNSNITIRCYKNKSQK